MAKIKVLEQDITTVKYHDDDYISLTVIANSKDGEQRAADIIKNWIRNRGTLEFIGTWEQLYNPNFKVVEFNHFKMSSGLPSFVLSPGKWVENTDSIGIVVKAGRYGGTYAHKDIAFEFASAINPIFKLYLIKEFQRLKEIEFKQLGWDIRRNLTKINYKIHTDAIKENLLPHKLTSKQIAFIYANEADMLNVALFGMTAKEFKVNNSDLKGNMRDYANVEQLVVLANMESMNAELIKNDISQQERLQILNKMAISQLKSISNINALKQLGEKKQ